MKNKIIHFLRYVNKFGFIKALFIYYKTRLSNLKSEAINLDYDEKLYIRPKSSDIYVFDLIFLWDEYSLKKFVQEPQFIVDLGANIGMSSFYLAKEFPDAKIIAVEPEENNFSILTKNVSQLKNIISLNKAIWSQNTKVYLSGNITNDNDGFIYSKNEGSNDIETTTISEIMRNTNFERIDILKIDIEGSEKELFEENYESWLGKVHILVIELHDEFKRGCSKSFFSALLNYDFSVYFRNKESLICLNNKF